MALSVKADIRNMYLPSKLKTDGGSLNEAVQTKGHAIAFFFPFNLASLPSLSSYYIIQHTVSHT